MSLPTFTFEVGFASPPLASSPAFTDLSADLESLSVSRGRQTDDDAASTGTATGVLNDDARRYDPNNTAGAYYPNVQPMKPVRIRATLDGTTYAVFYGWVDVQTGWIRVETEPSRAIVTVPCNDGFDILANGRVFTRTLVLDYFDAVMQYGPSLYWRLGEASGTSAIDSSGNGHTGTYSSCTLAQPGAPTNDGATSAAFTTSSSLFNPYGPFQATRRTLMGWAKRTSTTNVDEVYSAHKVGISSVVNALELAAGSENVVFANTATDTVTWSGAWPGTGSWVHWATIEDTVAQTVELFLNGVSQGAKTLAGSMYVGSFTVQPSGPLGYTGGFQDFATYESALSPTAIAAIYAARLVYPSAAVASSGCALTQETTGARIGDILGTGNVGSSGIGMLPQWPTAWRSLDAGLATVQSQLATDNASTDPLTLIRAAEETEPGFFFFDKTGYAAFKNRRSRLLATSQATFCDSHNLSGGRILYDSITTRRTAIVNVAQVTRTGGTQQEYVDSASQTDLMSRAKSYSTLHLDDATALEMAKWVVGQKKDSYEVLESLTLVPGTDSPTWVQVLSRELGDRITVVRTPPGGGASSTLDYFIEKIDLTWGPGPDAKCTWRLTPATQFNYWLAGTAGSSEAGTTTRAAY